MQLFAIHTYLYTGKVGRRVGASCVVHKGSSVPLCSPITVTKSLAISASYSTQEIDPLINQAQATNIFYILVSGMAKPTYGPDETPARTADRAAHTHE